MHTVSDGQFCGVDTIPIVSKHSDMTENKAFDVEYSFVEHETESGIDTSDESSDGTQFIPALPTSGDLLSTSAAHWFQGTNETSNACSKARHHIFL